MQDMWHSYERKRNALEKKWVSKVNTVLNNQLSSFIDSGMNEWAFFDFLPMYSLLSAIYKDVGVRFLKEQRKELNGKGFLPTMQTKLRARFNFSVEYANEIERRLRIGGLDLAQKISGTTKKLILEILAKGQQDNLSFEETAREIRRVMGPSFKKRAMVIVRTEVGRSANEGKLAGAKAMGIAMNKIWVTARDERVRRKPRDRADHLVMNGAAVELNELFSNELNLPGDVKARPEETINCRCTLVFKAIRDKDGRTIAKDYNNLPQPNQFLTGFASGISLGTIFSNLNADN